MMKILLTKTLIFTVFISFINSCSVFSSSNKIKEQNVWNYTDTLRTMKATLQKRTPGDAPTLTLGIAQIDSIAPLLKNKTIGVFINHTSQLDGKLLHEILLEKGYYVKKIFTPEHGLRASADAGAKVSSKTDEKTGLPIKSLYGNSKKPTSADLKGLDVIIFDMQDVGCRFYTYISSLEYMMAACAANGKRMIVLDRPNPNGHYVDGPVLESGFESFVGMQKIPIVHGMTVGEYALMLKGERLFDGAKDLTLTVVPCLGYTHQTSYSPPVFPSPNLRTDKAIQLYPSLCLFEGSDISVGRGTDMPFEVFGSPSIQGLAFDYSFIPKSSFGATEPKYEGQVCNGLNLRKETFRTPRFSQIPLGYVIDAYQNYRAQGKQSKFFTTYFNKLAGNATLQEQIKSNMTEQEIRASWQKDLDKFKAVREKYLLYIDKNVR